MAYNENEIELNLLEAEISQLNTKINSLEDERRNLIAQLSEEKSKNTQIIKVQNENRQLLDLINEKEQRIENLENEIIELKQENKTIGKNLEKK